MDSSAVRKKIVTRSSLACLACRSRHVKCDGKRPRCTRCDESGRLCNYAKSRRGGLGRAALIRLRQLAAAENQVVGNLIRATDSSAMPDARQEHDVDACLDTIVIDTPQGLTPERCDPTPPEPSRTYIRDFEDDALLDLYYKNFHKLHPLVLPQRHLVRLSQEADTQPRLVPLVAVMRLIGHLYGSREWSFPLQDALKTCFSQASQRDPFMVQCRVLYSIALFWYGYKTEAKNEIGMAARLALDLEMFRCQFATEQGGRNPVLAESWRRTWWMLFIVNGYYIGTVGTLEFALIDVEATVELPCGEFEYESGEIPKPKTLEDFDSREFALGNTSFSSFAYLVGAARCVASAAPMALGITPEDASLQVINTADSILDGWLLLLPRGSKQIMDKSGEIDELMFQAKLLVHVATISLHRPLSDLKFNTAEAISSCARKPPPDIPTPEMVNVHTVRVLRSIEAQICLLALPAHPFHHTPFATCMISEGTLALLSACKFLLKGRELSRARDQVRMTIGCLKALGDIWPRTARNLQEIQRIAQHALGLEEDKPIPSVGNLPSLPSVSSSDRQATRESDISSSTNDISYMADPLDGPCSWYSLGDIDAEMPWWVDQ
ncbi:uncharacterized protein TRIVIDRAFT_158628 [Trichoderma virens Gv29-8]|uniref:Zn(2)-C6 fungal-type domain-containing protein n=1 Tax=Hypocrea virens (strain Gv29-8 / FGSC 10586) TaxID=413071 RepID=G9N4T9_HYPVG|nr:uncharacterized protein TRIVIDRAFT_158628 [Trichoderma virens Gv29-8]EHK18613.1 hypothetical protein TRIVIDRAFT_158628 [Trichoderma virens Gv29-8]